MGRVTRIEGGGRRSRHLDEVETLAWLLDNSIPIPGTGRRIGIEPLIGLVPGLGDLLAGGLSLFVVLRAAQFGVPRIVLARMLFNVAVDFVVGAIPLVGDAFDLWFKANQRNLGLARRYVAAPETSTRGQWLFFGLVAAAVVVLAVAVAWALVALIGLLLEAL